MPLLADGRYDAVEELCQDDGRALPQLVELAVANRDLGYDQLRQVVTEVLQRDVMGDLEYRTNWIATVIKCGPLLGLFGTVLGMMAAFGRIGTGEKVQPSQIADEISIALICTAMGLGTAIPFNFMLASLTHADPQFPGRPRGRPDARARFLEDAAIKRSSAVQMSSFNLGHRLPTSSSPAGPIRRRPSSTSPRWSTWCS